MNNAIYFLALSSIGLGVACTHTVTFTPASVHPAETVPAPKTNARMAATVDARTIKQPIFTWTNWYHRYDYTSQQDPAKLATELVKEGLRRHGIGVVPTGGTMEVAVQLDEFNGANKGTFSFLAVDYKIMATIKIKGPQGVKKISVSGAVLDRLWALNVSNVNFLIDATYKQFLENFDKELLRVGI